jgi:hypothetical protein
MPAEARADGEVVGTDPDPETSTKRASREMSAWVTRCSVEQGSDREWSAAAPCLV